MATEVGAVLTQLTHVDNFLASQRGAVSDATLDASMKSMAQSIISQIGTLPELDVANASRLSTALQATRSFGVHEVGLMGTAINQRVTSHVGKGTSSSTKTQTMRDVRNYFTQNDWAVFQDEKLTLGQKVNIAADRMMLLGLKNHQSLR